MNHDELVAAYTAPSRHYHNLTHIEDCLGALAAVNDLSAAEREILTEAIWWHDVVYDPTRLEERRRRNPPSPSFRGATKSRARNPSGGKPRSAKWIPGSMLRIAPE
jgi:hypothetical protein